MAGDERLRLFCALCLPDETVRSLVRWQARELQGGGTPEKPVGLVYVHAAGPGGAARAADLNLPGDRATIRTRTTVAALHLVRKLVAVL